MDLMLWTMMMAVKTTKSDLLLSPYNLSNCFVYQVFYFSSVCCDVFCTVLEIKAVKLCLKNMDRK